MTFASLPVETVVVTHVRYEHRPELRRGVLIAAFRGWNDGGESATTAVAYLRDRWAGRPFAEIDPEEFFDFQVNRPTVRLVDGVTRRVEWPESRFFHAVLPERDAILFLGIEPNVRWRTFTQNLVEVAREFEVETTLTLGAFLADVPHTAATPVTGSAGDPARAEELGLSTSRYEGPTGIVGVVHDAFAKAGFTAASLWAAVPHYLPGGPNPKAARALVDKVKAFTGLTVETDTLDRAAATWETQVSATIEENPELAAYVKQLEQAASERQGFPEIPSGDSLAAELERFLRDQRGDG
jgi:proteasome assembly chaperone (PAC2) family protein